MKLCISIKARGMHSNATLEIPVHCNPRCAGVPPVAVCILKRIAVSRTLNETTGLVCDRIVRCVRKRSERIITCIDTRRVHVVLGSRSTVLQVVAAFVLRHPRSFYIRTNGAVLMILTKALPSMLLGIETEQPVRRALVGKLL